MAGPRQVEAALCWSSPNFGEAEMIEEVWATMKTQASESPAVALLHERIEGDLKLVGLTGGIASGKSTVSAMLRERGIPVIDADQIAREVVKPGEPAYEDVVAAFGPSVLNSDGTIDRERLGTIVFEDADKRRHLEDITHPKILRAIADQVHSLRTESNPKTIIVDAALLFESGLSENMDSNLLVAVPPEVQLHRLMARDGLAEDQAMKRIVSQMPLDEKARRADAVIDNSGSLEDTQTALNIIFSNYPSLKLLS